MGRYVAFDDYVKDNWAFARVHRAGVITLYQQLPEMREWAEQTTKSRYSFGWKYWKDGYYFGFFFKGVRDAALFRLTWC